MVSLREHEAREQAETATRSRDQFLAMISTSCTPLTAILGWCATLSGYPDRPATHGIEVIARNARAQLTLVNDLLDAAHVSSATFSITPQPVSLPEIVSHVLDTLRPAADEKHVTLAATNTGEESPVVAGDPDRLRQVLLNIVSNSLNYTDRDGAIEIWTDAQGGRARLTIHDSGKGISSSALPHVFEQFHRGDRADDGRAGLGLGLSIARSIVELHGGTIEIESPGDHQGTTCTIDLPLAARSRLPAASATPTL